MPRRNTDGCTLDVGVCCTRVRTTTHRKRALVRTYLRRVLLVQLVLQGHRGGRGTIRVHLQQRIKCRCGHSGFGAVRTRHAEGRRAGRDERGLCSDTYPPHAHTHTRTRRSAARSRTPAHGEGERLASGSDTWRQDCGGACVECVESAACDGHGTTVQHTHCVNTQRLALRPDRFSSRWWVAHLVVVRVG